MSEIILETFPTWNHLLGDLKIKSGKYVPYIVLWKCAFEKFFQLLCLKKMFPDGCVSEECPKTYCSWNLKSSALALN